MPIKNKQKKSNLPTDQTAPTATYNQTFLPPQTYKPIQPTVPKPNPFFTSSIPSSSTRSLLFFFDLARSLYNDDSLSIPAAQTYQAVDAPPSYDDISSTCLTSTSSGNTESQKDVLVLSLFRQTPAHITPVTERFHLGPADRQPFYAVTAQPSIRCATEPNELLVKRRDPIKGAWYPVCTSDIEPSLDLVKPGQWRVASLTMEAVPVWRKVVSGQMMKEKLDGGLGNKMSLWWGDRRMLGEIGDAYGLWWENGGDGGLVEAFYVVDNWAGFDSSSQGVVRIKPPYRDPCGKLLNPRTCPRDLATLYFHNDGATPPQLVCEDGTAQVRMDFLMAGLMTVLVIETRKAAVVRELGNLPSYHSLANWTSKLVEEGVDYEQ